MNFYQSKIWKKISKDIFKKDLFEIEIFWKKYWWITKEHKKFWISLNWKQILWIEIPLNYNDELILNDLKKIKSSFTSFWNVFFQLGFINELEQDFYKNRLVLEKNFLKKYWLFKSLRENMPLATVIVDIDKNDDEIFKQFSKSAKRNINKSIKQNIYFCIANEKDINNFYKIWENTAKTKWFNIYDYWTYLKLVYFLRYTNNWNLYLVKKWDTIVSWTIEINMWEDSYYLYWATNRNFTKLWGHYFLKYEMFKYLKKLWIKRVDLLWVSPNWYNNHHLKWVTQFKHSLWWKHIEYYGNYDLSLSFLYKFLRILHFKKWI